MDTGSHQEAWAQALIGALIAQGIDYFCYAPGSRCTPFALALAGEPRAKTQIHYDERGLCFHAVGYGKASRRPAVMIVTSGTAVGNLMPAVMEASNERTPLILLTADRPPELRDCGANQTVDQVKLFQNFVRFQSDLPCPEAEIPQRYLSSVVSHAVAMTTYPPGGPVHLNCMFREPLFSASSIETERKVAIDVASPVLSCAKETALKWSKRLAEQEKGVIVVGSSSEEISAPVIALAERLQWPIFPDILSSLRTGAKHPLLITHFDPILKLKGQIEAGAVIQFGDRLASKTLALWLDKHSLAFYAHICSHPMRQDPLHLVTDRVLSCPSLFIREVLSFLPQREEEGNPWSLWQESCQDKLEELFAAMTSLTEPGVISEIASFLTSDWSLFLGNGMPVRDANQFFSPCTATGPLFGNRGVSGIDGNIATAAGIAQGRGKPLCALIGDQAFLHDVNSLPLLKKTSSPVVLSVVNNDGSGIFSFMPIAKREEVFEEFFGAPHGYTFESACALFGIPYFHPKTPLELERLLQDIRQTPLSCVIEITTDRKENIHVHEFLIKEIGQCLSSATSPVEIPANLH